MKTNSIGLFHGVLVAFAVTICAPNPVIAEPMISEWRVVVNNGDPVPGDLSNRTFNSYNQPSVNTSQLVVFRARSRGGMGSEPVHGVYTRDMAAEGAIQRVFDRKFEVPQPNNLAETFKEPPSFPRIDIWSDTVASRGNHGPVWEYIVATDPDTGKNILSRAGTTGIYTNPFGKLITGVSNLGAVPDLWFFSVPDIMPRTKFDVFPGAPAATGGDTIVFKGNYTQDGISKTGVYYRRLEDATTGGAEPVSMIANSATTLIPGADVVFGSTAPPSAADGKAVFAGFDSEDEPTLGGIYMAPLDCSNPPPQPTPLVQIGDRVPGEDRDSSFHRLGEGVSFDGRFVAFWGAWGTETKTLNLQCPEEGNQDRVTFCNEQYPYGYDVQVPVNQGIFVHDTITGRTRAIAKAPGLFDDFVYWNFSGLDPGTGQSDEEGEPARWRSATFVAVTGLVDGNLKDATFHVAFKARIGDVIAGAYLDPMDGIYLHKGPGASDFVAVVETGMDASILDPEAIYDDDENPATLPVALPVTEMGVERDGFRGNSLVINVSMGTEEAGWAGIYLTKVFDED